MGAICVGGVEITINNRGVVIDPFEDIKSGNIVEYKNINYFFRPNGSVAYLFSNLKDYKMCRHIKCIRRTKLKDCPFYSCDLDLKSEEDTESSDHETYEDAIANRPTFYF